jgi:CO/xanthine dehydrogenase Mo-binding subunit/aerobic-type carbon monoxide dehydrogenase small subunit (CoxS/CutS family)
MADIRLEATVNGRKVARTAKPHQRLLDFLRDDLGLTGNKEGCGAGECGTCSVIVDGVLMKSCLLPVAKAQGSTIGTVEALAKTGELSVLQKAFHKAGASQCGYCIPGMLMAAIAALRANPFADREEIKARLGGNICRCTGYQKIFDAVEMARDVQNGRLPASIFDEEEVEQGDFIGKNVRSIDAPGKVSGRLKYAGDMTMPGMLHVQVLRSPHAHARIVSIDTSAAEAMDGVEGVITSADVPGEDGFGVIVNDQPVMACGKVRYVGEAVAAVAAEDLLTAKRALAAIKVVYEQLPAVFDPDEAMRAGAPVLHDYAPDNMTKHVPIRVGDVEKGLAESDLVVEEAYSTQAIEHAYLEPEAGLAYVDPDGVVTIVSPDQNNTHHRQMLARIIAKPIAKVRFIMSPVGGGFGGKTDMIYQGMLALLAMKTQRPVRLVFTREESMISTAKRHPSRTRLRMGLMRDGRIRALEATMVSDGGAYALSTGNVMHKAAVLIGGPYVIPNIKVDTYGVYTNNTPSGAFRSFGALQATFATESHLDLCAERLGLDPFQLRRINAMSDGAVTHTRQKLGSVSLSRVFDSAEKASGWEVGAPVSRGGRRSDLDRDGIRPPCTLGAHFAAAGKQEAVRRDDEWVWRAPHTIDPATARDLTAKKSLVARKRGRGMAACWYGIARAAPADRAAAWVEIDDGGSVKVVTGVTEIGAGILTVVAQIAAQEIGVKPEDVVIGDNDTARAPGPKHAGGSRQTYMVGNVVALASREARKRLAEVIAGAWDVNVDLIHAGNGEVWAEGTNHRISMGEAVDIAKKRGVVPVGSASFGIAGAARLDPVDGSGRPWQAYVFGCQVAEVEVDTVTGEVQVLGIWAAHDVGRAVNPQGVEGQIEGGIAQALGQGLMEDYKLESGRTSTPGFAKYILPTSLDVPQVNSIIIEDLDPYGPLGVKGVGELSLVPTIPAIMNAIYDAVGVRITNLPATPEKVLMAIRDKERRGSHMTPQAGE